MKKSVDQKLTKTSPVDQFYLEAHLLLHAKEGQYTLEDVVADMKAKCDETVDFQFIKDIVIYELNDFINNGFIRCVDENLYENVLIKDSTL